MSICFWILGSFVNNHPQKVFTIRETIDKLDVTGF